MGIQTCCVSMYRYRLIAMIENVDILSFIR